MFFFLVFAFVVKSCLGVVKSCLGDALSGKLPLVFCVVFLGLKLLDTFY